MAEARFADLFVSQPDLARIEELVRHCEWRKARAAAKLASAEAECAAAEAAYQRAIAARADWIASNPDPQLLML